MSHHAHITLTDKQDDHLRQVAVQRGLSLTELVRHAVDRCYPAAIDGDLQRALDDSFGSWTDRDFDGADYVDGLRSGIVRL